MKHWVTIIRHVVIIELEMCHMRNEMKLQREIRNTSCISHHISTHVDHIYLLKSDQESKMRQDRCKNQLTIKNRYLEINTQMIVISNLNRTIFF